MTTRPRSEAHVGFHDVSDFESWIFDSAGHEIFFQILLVQVLADKHLGFFQKFRAGTKKMEVFRKTLQNL